MIFLSNAFSLSMIMISSTVLTVEEISIEQVKGLLSNSFTSAVGHQATADIISKLTGIQVPVNRISISLSEGDKLIVFQITTRLPEGAVLTENELNNIPHKWYVVEVISSDIKDTVEALYHW